MLSTSATFRVAGMDQYSVFSSLRMPLALLTKRNTRATRSVRSTGRKRVEDPASSSASCSNKTFRIEREVTTMSSLFQPDRRYTGSPTARILSSISTTKMAVTMMLV